MKAHELFKLIRALACDADVQLCASGPYNLTLTGIVLDQDSEQITLEVDVEECKSEEVDEDA